MCVGVWWESLVCVHMMRISGWAHVVSYDELES